MILTAYNGLRLYAMCLPPHARARTSSHTRTRESLRNIQLILFRVVVQRVILIKRLSVISNIR